MFFHFDILHKGADHPFLNSFKLCALTGLNVNYTNAGTYASYDDGTPVNIRMNITFKELNPIYSEDYEGMMIVMELVSNGIFQRTTRYCISITFIYIKIHQLIIL